MSEPAYSRLQLDERRRQLIDAGAALFAERSFEEITMRQVADAAGVSKALLYHYFPSKIELFKAAVNESAQELRQLIEPSGEGSPIEQLAEILDAYLAWIETHAQAWTKLLQSASALPEARELVDDFRARALQRALQALTGKEGPPPPALRTALNGWFGAMDAATLDWTRNRDLERHELARLLLAAFGAALRAAGDIDGGLPEPAPR